jgi:16S rRNA (guanine527-N7)-methyltransferase
VIPSFDERHTEDAESSGRQALVESRLDELFLLISGWPGMTSKPDRALVDDCLVLLPWLGDARRVIDVGSGAGLPGLPLKLARPDIELTLIEANRARAAFLVQAVARLGLDSVDVVADRAENAGRDPRYREAFDLAVARAVAPMPVLAELTLPLLRPGGRLLAMKTGATRELESAAAAIAELGGELSAVEAAPSAARDRGEVVVISKTRPTPDRYPRRPGIPARRPIGM